MWQQTLKTHKGAYKGIKNFVHQFTSLFSFNYFKTIPHSPFCDAKLSGQSCSLFLLHGYIFECNGLIMDLWIYRFVKAKL